jgi:hypothetical protein
VVTVILVDVLLVIVQASPFKVTEVAEVKFVPEIVIVAIVFEQVLEGVKEVIAGPGAA